MRPTLIDTVFDEQIVFQRDKELGTAGVSLTSGATAQLMVDAAALVSVRSNDLQAPQRSHPISQANVDSTAGHIGRNSHGPRLLRISYDPCLFLLIAGIQYLVRDILLRP